ncbi:phosphatase PAP2 family protein [Kaistella jeonii]|uniref:phosphatase PAP2 family protein n=1 Tax=Kaistella jeonii TaxID=266749 RepID=UPI00068B546B|nr:phosphatase PAP2 family protein [Kaistella jeonii]SFB90933.1 undecaprenyl-diphosphatase [Kaistella jeonii]VEI95767.1 Putative undecaprenyl-diphosphatase ybjG [Kaistella jeonii]
MKIQFLKDFYANNSAKLLISLLFLLIALFLLVEITDEMVLEKEDNVDFLVFKFFNKYVIRNSLTGFMSLITQFSSTPFIKVVYPFLIIILLIFKFYRKAIFTFLAGVGGLLLIYGMKMFFARPRPPYPLIHKEENFSFPSGHATFSFIFYGTLAYFIWLTDLPKVWKYIAMIFLISLSLTIGLSRVYLRVHFPSDVLGGFCLGYSWLFLMIFAFRKWYPLN